MMPACTDHQLAVAMFPIVGPSFLSPVLAATGGTSAPAQAEGVQIDGLLGLRLAPELALSALPDWPPVLAAVTVVGSAAALLLAGRALLNRRGQEAPAPPNALQGLPADARPASSAPLQAAPVAVSLALAAHPDPRCRLLPFPPAIRQSHPPCLASNDHHFAVLGEDGVVRRFPPDNGASTLYPVFDREGRMLDARSIGETFKKQLAFYYDAHADAIIDRRAGYMFDPDTNLLVYHVYGQPVDSLTDRIEAYLVAPGKWMIPQDEVRGCTYACEDMLLAEGEPPEAVARQLGGQGSLGTYGVDGRRSSREIVESLGMRSGRQPVAVDANAWTMERSIEVLQAMLEQHGPCILSTVGHARMLDGISRQSDDWVFDMRDPFTGTTAGILNHEGLWAPAWGRDMTPLDPRRERTWHAIFLPRG
jgi:hypothetical protein